MRTKLSITILFGLLITVVLTNESLAATIISDITVANSAEMTLTSTPTMNVTLKNLSDDQTATKMTWSSTTSNWNKSDQYIQIDYDANDIGWGIRIYTDNNNASADPSYTGPTSSGSEGAGLIGVTDTTQYAPLAWTAIDALTDTPSALPTDSVIPSNAGWAYFKDPIQSSFSNNVGDDQEYLTIINSSGMALNTVAGRDYNAASPIFLHVAGNFKNIPNQTYRTNQIILELFHQ